MGLAGTGGWDGTSCFCSFYVIGRAVVEEKEEGRVGYGCFVICIVTGGLKRERGEVELFRMTAAESWSDNGVKGGKGRRPK